VRVGGARDDPFELLGDPGGVAEDAPPGFVGGGWFGYLGFELGARIERLGPPPPVREALPPFVLAWYDHVLRLDGEGQWWFEALRTEERGEALERRLAELRARLADGVAAPGAVATSPWRADPSPRGHGSAVAACRERIAGGDLYQANLSLRLRSRLDGEPADLFARAAAALAPDRAAFLAGDWGAVASLSPELYLERRGDVVRSAPIKGTRPRDPAGGEGARAELAASAKDRAENMMIVDLVRNDLGRVSQPGSVAVRALAEPRAHPGVWHLVSEVEGRLAPGRSDADLLRASFPPGSVTGAPKLAAIDVIGELESAARNVFSGAIGFASPAAGLELSVAIRTFEIAGEAIWLDVGGGIVADSDPAAEAEEALVKARPLLAAIGGSLATGSPVPPAAAPLRLGPRPVQRPDPALGVFETVLVSDGVAVALSEHLARLAASCNALGLGSLPADTGERAAALAAKETVARLRISVSGAAEITAELAPLPERNELVLVPVTVPGGLGPHKWNDRRLVDALSKHVAPAVPLLVDLDGYVLEAAWANVLLLDAEGVLCTPPLDGRILPGVTRALALAEARAAGGAVAERTIHLDELESANEVLLSSALAGLAPATLRTQ
jgi:para-aminobenzoate synthetase/4-amino-4-deoxychorismate lyase